MIKLFLRIFTNKCYCKDCVNNALFNLIEKTTFHHYCLGFYFGFVYAFKNGFGEFIINIHEIEEAIGKFALEFKYKRTVIFIWYSIYCFIFYKLISLFI